MNYSPPSFIVHQKSLWNLVLLAVLFLWQIYPPPFSYSLFSYYLSNWEVWNINHYWIVMQSLWSGRNSLLWNAWGNRKGLHDVTLPKKSIDQAFPGLQHKGAVSNHTSQRLKSSWVFINTVPKSFSMGISDAQKFAGLPFFGRTKAHGWATMQRLGLCSFTSQAKSILVTNTKNC